MAESVENAISEFYKLKSKYETDILKKKKVIINDVTLSSQEKKNEFKKLKPKCINCKRPGGTLFSVKFFTGKDEYREFKSVCGVVADPCNLNITVQVGKYDLLPVVLEGIEKEIDDNKKSIIDDKNRLLFGLMTTETALQKFEGVKDYIANLTSLLETYLDEYNSITDNLEKKLELKESIIKSYFYIDEIKESIKQFNQENNTQYVRDIVNIYINNLKPLLNKITDLKYKENTIHYNESDNTYNLIQNQYTIESLEFTEFNNKVLNYDVGLKVIIPKTPVKGLIIESSSDDK
jgi:CII-binding regulator of phage lambda lysogenization HflD